MRTVWVFSCMLPGKGWGKAIRPFFLINRHPIVEETYLAYECMCMYMWFTDALRALHIQT
jgi:hypothetical protein